MSACHADDESSILSIRSSPLNPETDMEYLYYSVITTNAGNLECRLPEDERDWTEADRKQFHRLDRKAEAVGTYIQRHDYPLLGSDD